MPIRRSLFALLGLSLTLVLLWLAVRVLAPGGWTLWEALLLLCFAGTAPWTALCAANALLGFAILITARDPPAAVLPALRRLRPGIPALHTAIAVCIRNEDMAQVLPPLRRLAEGLAAAGAADRFTLWFLSDTTDPAAAAAEQRAIAAFQPGGVAVRYRRRDENIGFKAGNVMDFLDNHAGDAALMLCLDADSAMTAPAVLRLVACMEADPRLAIVQQLIVGRPATAAFPRLFQFGMRAGMRSWATGQAWWQGADGPYWGHNAIIRIAPFRRHARLETLPDGRPILSHDQVEAVRLHAAGWKVMCLPAEDGSMEGNPPALPEFMARDLRWAAGNMQYWDLLRLPGMTAMGRWQLVQAILLFLGAPLWVGVLVFAALNAATGGGAATPDGWLLALLATTWAMLHAPKLAGYAQVLLTPALAARYGGRAAFLRGAAAEILFTTLLDPVSVFNKAMFLLALPFGGRRAGWAPQNRADRGVAWADAARLLWPHTLFGLAVFGVLAAAGVAGWALPFAGGLLAAIPFCVVTASPGFSAELRDRRLAATPEELLSGDAG
ncbi:glucans biosynthesis glucosyltransferase MdoH [Paracraurococcus ruber]|uniref:Glucans biosynthesis glucosyltransferase H n=1 Tax=Paracraurococcus ruber TaxID=77675 RepID=A0ABS1CU25_9PROT|nr:glucans biosynthesis glucosyltransferase MdoH [Paracraurococcus ruber]MBK1657972.1 glucan biosynthesis glucosyltransferase H [Paracraurococcus ruber]TDG30382.1 glucans biosynthesis glucosyltransferase MdoH [Paracraurococcus ruber]